MVNSDKFGESDPYVECTLTSGSKDIVHTKTKSGDCNPKWNETGELSLSLPKDNI